MRYFASLSLFCIVLFSACKPIFPLYYASIEPSQYDAMSREMQLKFVLIEDDFSPEFKQLLHALNQPKSWTFSAEEEMASRLTDIAEQNFAIGYIYLLQRKFSKAEPHFIVASTKIPQAKILLLDCVIELRDGRAHYTEYQTLYDETEDERMRYIIKTRYKYFRYGI